MSKKSRTDQITTILALVEFAREVDLDLMLTEEYENRGILALVKNILIKDQKALEGQREPRYALTGKFSFYFYHIPLNNLRQLLTRRKASTSELSTHSYQSPPSAKSSSNHVFDNTLNLQSLTQLHTLKVSKLISFWTRSSRRSESLGLMFWRLFMRSIGDWGKIWDLGEATRRRFWRVSGW